MLAGTLTALFCCSDTSVCACTLPGLFSVQHWVQPACRVLETFSWTPLGADAAAAAATPAAQHCSEQQQQQQEGPAQQRSSGGACGGPHAAEVLLSSSYTMLGVVLPALIAFWQERHYKGGCCSRLY